MSWNGEERRQENINILIEMRNDLKHFIKALDEHKNDFKQHKSEDDINFKRIDKTIYLTTGVVTAVIFVVRMIWK